MSTDEFIPIENWGRDHWSTLAYIETIMVEKHAFTVTYDPHMRHNRRNYRVMGGMEHVRPGPVMDRIKHASRLRDGTTVENHDDWCSSCERTRWGPVAGNRKVVDGTGPQTFKGIQNEPQSKKAY